MRASDTPVFKVSLGHQASDESLCPCVPHVPHVSTLPLWSPLGPPGTDWRLERKRTHFPRQSLASLFSSVSMENAG